MSNSLDKEVQSHRKAEYPIHNLFLNRWSPRAMTGEKISDEELFPLFEAAKWAPSSYNGQPWRFLYAKKGSKHWETFFELLLKGNQEWAQNASCLVVILSRRHFDTNGKPERTHTFDAGAAWMSLALQATHQGLATRGMQGLNYEKARRDLKIDKEYEVEAMIAIGKRGSKETLSSKFQEAEHPNQRHALKEIIHEGGF